MRAKLQLSRLARTSTRRAALVGPPEHWELQRRFQIDFLTAQGLAPSHRLIDIGCGTLRGGIPLIEFLDTGNYTGVEVRADVLEEARRALAESGFERKRPQLICAATPAQIPQGRDFHFVWAFMALIHMPDEVVDAYLQFASQRLSDRNGAFYGNVAIGDQPDGEWQGFPVVSRSREFYERAAAAHGLRTDDLGQLGSLGHPLGVGGNTVMLRFTRRA